jgi:hypothetical protein
MRGHEYFPSHWRQGLGASLAVWLVFTALQTSCSGPVEPQTPEGADALALQSTRQEVVNVTTAGAARAADLAFLASGTSLRTFYVSKSGSNTDCLSRATACRTLTRALSLMTQPGDKVIVVGASTPYSESISINPDLGGTAANPKYILGETSNGYRAVIVPSNGAALSFNSSYWVVDNLTIDCQGAVGPGVNVLSSNFLNRTPTSAHHVALRNLRISRCQSSAIELRYAEDVLVEGSELTNNRKTDTNGYRLGSHGVTLNKGTKRVLIRNNKATGNSGDGVQCQGREQESDLDAYWDVRDLTIESNEFANNDENAVDIKSCQGVSIIGANSFHDHKAEEDIQAEPRLSAKSCGGSAILLHYAAQRVLIEGAQLAWSGRGITVGNEYFEVTDVAIRRNEIYGMNQTRWQTPKGLWRVNCGDGIAVNRGSRIDIYHNTLKDIAHSGILVGHDTYYRSDASGPNTVLGPANAVRVWNNILSDVKGLPAINRLNGTQLAGTEGGFLDYNVDNTPGRYSDYNLYHGAQAALFRRSAGLTATTQTSALVNLATWRAQTGMDPAPTSLEADPRLVHYGVSTSGGWRYRWYIQLGQGSFALDSALVDAGNTGAYCAGGPDRGAYESDCNAGGGSGVFKAADGSCLSISEDAVSVDSTCSSYSSQVQNAELQLRTVAENACPVRGGADAPLTPVVPGSCNPNMPSPESSTWYYWATLGNELGECLFNERHYPQGDAEIHLGRCDDVPSVFRFDRGQLYVQPRDSLAPRGDCIYYDPYGYDEVAVDEYGCWRPSEWEVRSDGSLYNVSAGRCLTKDWQYGLVMANCDGDSSQLWYWSGTLRSPGGHCVETYDAPEGTRLRLNACDNSVAQQWSYVGLD